MLLFCCPSEPHVTDIARDSCLVTWQAVKSMGRDRLEYSLQLQRLYGKDNSKADEYKEVRTVRACLSLASRVPVSALHGLVRCWNLCALQVLQIFIVKQCYNILFDGLH